MNLQRTYTPRAAFALIRNKECSCVLQVFHPPSGMWSLPGGKVETESSIVGAIRELNEETGVSGIFLRRLHEAYGDANWIGRDLTRLLHVIEAYAARPNQLPELHNGSEIGPEGTALRWGSLESLAPFFGKRFISKLNSSLNNITGK